MEKLPKTDIARVEAESAQSHIGRVKEGHSLLEQGRSLSEMQTPVTGPSNEYLQTKRLEFIDSLNGKSPDELRETLTKTEKRIERYQNKKLVGVSGLLWQRNIILEKLGEI